MVLFNAIRSAQLPKKYTNLLVALRNLFFYLPETCNFEVDGINTWQLFVKIHKGGFTQGHVEFARLPSSNMLLYSEQPKPVYPTIITKQGSTNFLSR